LRNERRKTNKRDEKEYCEKNLSGWRYKGLKGRKNGVDS
jgi:hypothetical protein